MGVIESVSRRRFLLASAMALQVPVEKGVVAIVLGPPGSGKTTQAEFIAKRYKIPIFSAETLIKKSHDRKSDFTKKVKGKLAPEELLGDIGMNDLVREAVLKADHKRGFVMDGYPMNRPQAEYFANLLKEQAMEQPLVVHLDTPDATIKARMEARRRADDKPDIIERRIAAYRDEEQAVLGYYGAGRVLRVDGNKTASEISEQIAAALTARGK